MVRAQVALLDGLGIEQLHAVVGGSMGGMLALSFAANFPGRTERVLAIATTARHSAQNIAFHEVGRQAVMADPNWQGGDYYERGRGPEKGLAVARMAAHITYLSEAGLTDKFGRRLQDRKAKSFGFDADFQIESYLRHQGIAFTDRFDANAYLYITRAMDYFDLAEEHGGRLADAFTHSTARFCLVSFDTDWLYPTADSRAIVHALNATAKPVSFVELSAPYGHDSFLLECPPLDRVIKGFLE
jgi:homoserine O-acetyltransferase